MLNDMQEPIIVFYALVLILFILRSVRQTGVSTKLEVQSDYTVAEFLRKQTHLSQFPLLWVACTQSSSNFHPS